MARATRFGVLFEAAVFKRGAAPKEENEMSVSPEEKKRYLHEAAIALRREGFRIEPSVGGRLGVWLDDHPICEVDQIGGITYRIRT